MPRGDRTGPMGMGPMTGRAAGYCAGFSAPGFVNHAPRMGMGFRRGAGFYGRGPGVGRGLGRGRGFGNFGRGMAFRGQTPNFGPVAYQGPFNPNYGYFGPYQYPAYPAGPTYGIW